MFCETMQNQHYSPIKKKQRNLSIRFEPFLLVEVSPPLENCPDIYVCLTACLIITLLLNVLVPPIFSSFLSSSSLYL